MEDCSHGAPGGAPLHSRRRLNSQTLGDRQDQSIENAVSSGITNECNELGRSVGELKALGVVGQAVPTDFQTVLVSEGRAVLTLRTDGIIRNMMSYKSLIFEPATKWNKSSQAYQ